MHILITGGAGYIGSHVAKLLLENTEHQITILDNLSTGFIETIETLQDIRPFNFIQEDLSNWDKIAEFLKSSKDFVENNNNSQNIINNSFEKFDAVIHFAASLVVPESMTDPLKYYLNNTANTSNFIRECVKNSVNKFIFSSTAATYGEPTITEPIKETAPTLPINPYGQSKLFVEKILQDTASAHKNFKFVILRYFNAAGASDDLKIGQRTAGATHLIKVASETALGKRDKMYIFGDDYPTADGTCVRDYIHVLDLADAHLKSLDYLSTGQSDIFNCGYGTGYSVKEVLNTVQNVSNPFKIETIGKRAGDPALLVADSTKIREKMGWQPKYDSLKTICKTAYEWEKTLK